MREIPYWKQEMLKAEKRNKIKEDFPDLGRIVKYRGEYGVVVYEDLVKEVTGEDAEYGPLYVSWDSKGGGDFEGFPGLPYVFLDKYKFKNINNDGRSKT